MNGPGAGAADKCGSTIRGGKTKHCTITSVTTDAGTGSICNTA